MPIFDDMKTQAEAIRKDLDQLLAVNRDEVYGKDRLSTLSFAVDPKSKEVFESTFDLFEEISKCNLDRIPPQQLAALKERITPGDPPPGR